jgi:hypothetical protein
MSNSEQGLLALGILILIFLLYILKNYIEDTAPLTELEINNLSKKRRLKIFADDLKLVEYSFHIDIETKKKFGPKLKYYEHEIEIGTFPSWCAGLLKGKKHEWLIIAIGDMKSIKGYWLEKGKDNKSIQTSLSNIELIVGLNQGEIDNLFIIHNHPGSNLFPSENDKECIKDIFSRYSYGFINVLGFIACRGKQNLFACFLNSQIIPYEIIRTEITKVNNITRKTNGILRDELRERISYVGKVFNEDYFVHNLSNK